MDFSQTLLNLLFPLFCCGCGKIGRYLCFTCYEKVEFVIGEVELKLPKAYISSVHAAVHYQQPIDSLLHQLKYQSVKDIGKFCGQLMYQTVNLPEVDLITFIPIHHAKQRVRGFNQAQEIAQTLAQFLTHPCSPLLTRTKPTKIQAQLKSDQERMENLREVFACNSQTSIIGKRILLVDDVVTTGSTLNEAARVLLQAGVQEVHGVAVAHGQ